MKTPTLSPVHYSLLLGLFPLLAFIQMNCLNILLPHLATSWAVPQDQLDILSAFYSAAVALSLLPAGWLLDRVPFKLLLASSMGLMAIGSFCFAEAHTLNQALAARFLTGVSHSFAFISCFRWITLRVPVKQQGLLTGLTLTFAFLGGFLSAAPFAVLVNRVGWQTAMVYQSGIISLLLVLFLFILPPLPNTPTIANKIHTHILFARCFFNLRHWLIGLYTCLMGGPLMLLGSLWGTQYLITSHAMTPLAAASTSGMLFLGALCGSPLIGLLADRFNNTRQIMLVGAGLLICSLWWVHILHTDSVFIMAPLFFIMGIFSSTGVLGYVVIQENNQPETTSFIVSFVNVIIMAGTASFQLAFSLLETHVSTHTYGFYFIVILVMTSWFIAYCMQPKPQEQLVTV